jgi:hypothetical protein
MRKLISLALLFLATAPVFAAVHAGVVPEPEVLGMLAIGGVALLLARRKK